MIQRTRIKLEDLDGSGLTVNRRTSVEEQQKKDPMELTEGDGDSCETFREMYN